MGTEAVRPGLVRIESPRWFQHVHLVLVTFLVGASVGLFVVVTRIVARFAPEVPPEQRWLLDLLYAMGAVQIVVALVMAYVMLKLSRTRVEFDEAAIVIRHPFGEWRGSWNRLRRAYQLRGFLLLETDEQPWGAWQVKLSPSAPTDSVARLRRHLARGVWLDERQARRYVLRKWLPVLVVATLVGGATVYGLEALRQKILAEPPRVPSGVEDGR